MPILGIIASSFRSAGGGPQGAYDSLATVTLSATTASISFSGLPSGYKHLQLRVTSRTNTSGERNNMFYLTYNGDTAANYSWHALLGNGASVFAESGTSQSIPRTGQSTAASALTGNMGAAIIDILDYSSADKFKTLKSLTGFDNNGAGELYLNSTNWRSLAPVTSITITPGTLNGASSFVADSTFALYGVK